MKKIVLVYGAIAGIITGGMLMITMPLYESGAIHLDDGNGEWLGYTTMVVALSGIFFAIKSYRDNYAMGKITFWGGTKVGLLVTLVASIIYALSWEVTRANMKGDLIQMMNEKHMEKLKAAGTSPEKMVEEQKSIAEFTEAYKNPVIRFSLTIAEIAPVGIVISLICAGLLRRREFLPSTVNN